MSSLALGSDSVDTSAQLLLTAEERAEMFDLLSQHFDGVTRDQFERDLSEKQWALRLRREGRLVGFSTLRVYPAQTDRGAIHVFYSGDTIVAPEAWDSPTLARGWIGMVKRIQSTLSAEPCYWLLLSSGFRTYRLLPVFWREFWPRFDAVTPPEEHSLMRLLAENQFGPAFEASRGLVRFSRPQRLKPFLSSIPAGRERDPHVRFFLDRNPHFADGDELVCLTRLSDDNLTPAGARMVRYAL